MKAIRTILACIRKADQQYNLINHGDKIVVGLSGGKDSIVLTYALTLYQKFSHTDFKIQPVTLNLGFPGFNSKPLEEFCLSLGLQLLVVDATDVYKILQIQQDKQDTKHLPCSICSRMKKAAINKVAKEIGFNKVAFAHHADDAVETLLMNAIYGSRIATFAPYMHLEKADMDFIRPLILCHEKEIKQCIKEENLIVVDSHCPADKTTTREDVKNILNDIYKKYPNAKDNFVTMLSNYEHLDLWGNKIALQVNQEGLYLKPVISKMDALKMYDIRYRIFVEEEKIPYKDEIILSEDEKSENFLICLKDQVIGTIRYTEEDRNTIKICRFALEKEYRNKGYGTQVFSYFSDYLKAKYNPCTLYIHGQLRLKDYYAKFGYIPVGDKFFEGNIEHIKMIKECK